jgi:hypothetical protein
VGTAVRPPKWIKPRLTLVDEAPTGPDRVHEIKYDRPISTASRALPSVGILRRFDLVARRRDVPNEVAAQLMTLGFDQAAARSRMVDCASTNAGSAATSAQHQAGGRRAAD